MTRLVRTSIVALVLLLPKSTLAYDSWTNEYRPHSSRGEKVTKKTPEQDPNLGHPLFRLGPEVATLRFNRRLQVEFADSSTQLIRTFDTNESAISYGFRSEAGYVFSQRDPFAAAVRGAFSYGYLTGQQGVIETLGHSIEWKGRAHSISPALGAELQLLRRHLTLSLDAGLDFVHQNREAPDAVATINDQSYWMPTLRFDVGYRTRISRKTIFGVRAHFGEGIHRENFLGFDLDRWRAGLNLYFGFDPEGKREF